MMLTDVIMGESEQKSLPLDNYPGLQDVQQTFGQLLASSSSEDNATIMSEPITDE